jgi:hypothetical protein
MNKSVSKRLAIAVVQILQGILANLAGIVDEVTESTTLRILGINLNPTTVRWKSQPNCTIDKCLNGSSWCSKLLGQEDSAV